MILPALALVWLLAMAAVGVWGAPGWIAAAWLAPLAPAAWLWRGRKVAAWMGVAAVLALVAGVRFEAWYERPPPDIARFVGQEVTVAGRIASEPDPGRTSVRHRVEVERVTSGDRTAASGGAVLATFPQYTELLPGDRVRFTAELEEPPVFEDFDYRGYLATRGIVATAFAYGFEQTGDGSGSPQRWATRFRLRLEDALQRALPEPEASLGAGIVFGRDDELPDDVAEDFRTTGLAHITAVSGANVALVSAVVFLVLVRVVPHRWALLPAALTVAGYIGVAGFSFSVVRAGLMAGVVLLGYAIGRPRSSLPALAAAVIAMTAFRPSSAADVGFQLSVAATAGLVVFGPWVRAGLDRAVTWLRVEGAVPSLVLETTALSLAATLATVPISWYTFGRVSVIGVVANVVIEPLFMLVFWAAALTAIAGMAWEPAGWFTGFGAYYLLAFVIGFAELLADVPGAAIDVPPGNAGLVLLACAALCLAGWPAYRFLPPVRAPAEPAPGIRTVRRTAMAGTACAVAAVALPLTLLPMRGPGALRVDVLDVGQGDAILLTTPGGERVLIDGGPSGIELARELSAVLPHWERKIETVILTHPQSDHLGGLPELFGRYEAGEVLAAGTPHDSAIHELFLATADHRPVPVARGDAWEVDGLRFEVLWPAAGYLPREVNDASVVLAVTYEGVSLLLAGDIEAGGQRELMASTNVRADVLKVPHHGSKSSDPAFFDAVGAGLAIISVGATNTYGHPADETLAPLGGTRLVRTDRDGRVRLTIRDGRVRVWSER
ncbi:MAG: DNA internalization-related competence protein ComEC/Rec2 [Dehalococcoidia bacterium]|nr:DNA internalization-related competence protein ComEC/Rec2 [Dehalococcoidia bacterium]